MLRKFHTKNYENNNYDDEIEDTKFQNHDFRTTPILMIIRAMEMGNVEKNITIIMTTRATAMTLITSTHMTTIIMIMTRAMAIPLTKNNIMLMVMERTLMLMMSTTRAIITDENNIVTEFDDQAESCLGMAWHEEKTV